ncbi:MAG: M23 family metallopeptidase [Thermomicrobiales bacterium]
MNGISQRGSWARVLAWGLAITVMFTMLAACWNGGAAATDWSPMRLPFAGKRYISNGPNCTTHSGSSAQAIDIPMDAGTDVLAAQAGTVVWAGRDPAQPSFGTLLKIRHADGSVAWYAHLDDILTRVNDTVANGEIVARSGATGGEGTSGPFDAHLHFEVRDQAGVPRPIDALPGITWFSDDLCGTGKRPAGVAIGAPPSTTGKTLVWFELLVPGIGRNGNHEPLAAERTKITRVTLLGTGNTDHVFQATATYEPETGSFIGVADLSDRVPDGQYWIVLRLPNTLGKNLWIIPMVRNGLTTVLPRVSLKSGDVDDDNILNAFTDYRILAGCYSVHRPPPNCASNAMRGGSDLNDDGRVDYEDHDIFITLFSAVEGD